MPGTSRDGAGADRGHGTPLRKRVPASGVRFRVPRGRGLQRAWRATVEEPRARRGQLPLRTYARSLALSLFVSLSLYLFDAHTHTKKKRVHAHTHTHTRTSTHTLWGFGVTARVARHCGMSACMPHEGLKLSNLCMHEARAYMGLKVTGREARHCASRYRYPGSGFEFRVEGGYSARGAPLRKGCVHARRGQLSLRQRQHLLHGPIPSCLGG